MPSLDRFAIGIADSQDAGFWECSKRGNEVYADRNTDEDDCPACKEAEVSRKFIAFRKELRMLELRNGVRVTKDVAGEFVLVDEETGEEEAF